MDRSLEKYIERIRKYRAKGNHQKALRVVDEAFKSGEQGLELSAESVGLSFHLDSWPEALTNLKSVLREYPLGEVCGGRNREDFMRLVHDHAGFRTSLMDFLLNIQDYNGIGGWVRISDLADREWLVQIWTQSMAGIEDPIKIAAMRAALGVALFVNDKWIEAWEHWSHSLKQDPRLLKKIMAFCQASGQMDTTLLENRIWLIKLISAAGKKNETMSLLLALGLESRQNALKVLTEIPDFMPGELKNKDILTLRFKLALRLQDPEILFSVIADMDQLKENDLFPLRKQAMLKVTNIDLRRSVLLRFVSIYIHNNNWENAAFLLETLYEEKPHEEIVALMEEVLDNYPIMSQLHFTCGRYYLDTNNRQAAITHLSAIREIEEYTDRIQTLLENALQREYVLLYAQMLLIMHEPYTNQAGLIAAKIVMEERGDCKDLVNGLYQESYLPIAGPFWYLALINGFCETAQYDRAYALLCRFLATWPSLGTEAIRPAERICSKYRHEFPEIIKLLETHSQELVPRKAWEVLQRHFTEATEKNKAKLAKARAQQEEIQDLDATMPPTRPLALEVKTTAIAGGYQDRFVDLFRGGNWQAAADLTLEAIDNYPDDAAGVLEHLDELVQDYPHESLWMLTYLEALKRVGEHARIIEHGQNAINNPKYQGNLPEIYNYLALAYDAMDHEAEALRFLCLSCRNPHFYESHREKLHERVLPSHPHLLKEILHLALVNEDEEGWEYLMKAWYEYRPEDMEHLIKAQQTFANKLGSAQAMLHLAYWYLQAGRRDELIKTLNAIDLQNAEIMDLMVNLISLIKLKYPDDPRAPFLLGRYYLIQEEVPKAVDTFRNLARQIPSSAEAIYNHLRNFMKSNPGCVDLVYLYGLQIRFTLDYDLFLPAVRLLDELGRQDQAAAESLTEGVYRVLLQKGGALEPLFEFSALLRRWSDFERLLAVNDRVGFGTHMANERLKWFEEAKKVPELKDRANLTIAGLLFEMQHFEKCRHALGEIEDSTWRRKALPLYARLAERFPDRMDLWREAGWAAFPEDLEQAGYFFRKVFETGAFHDRVEAFAVLSESGEKLSLDSLKEIANDEDALLGELRQVFHHIREMELAYWKKKGEGVPLRVLQWLIATHQHDQYRECIDHAEPLDEMALRSLSAAFMEANGEAVKKAWHVLREKASLEEQLSALFNAGMIERAILLKKAGARIPTFLRERFCEEYGRPKLIRARYSQIQGRRGQSSGI